jgi:N-methylhydantoinase A
MASEISLSAQDSALGIIRVVNANMERAIRAISLERGYDPRQFTMVPFGGAGPMHCCELAQELGIPRVLVPARPGILSALGVAIADIVKDYSRTVMLKGDDINRARLDEEFHGMEGLAREELEDEGLPMDRMQPQRFLDVRYVGQSFELTIDYPSPSRRMDTERMRRSIADSFYKAHLQRFGYADKSEAVEIVNLRFKLGLELDKPQVVAAQAAASDSKDALLGEAQVVFSGGPTTTRLYDRDKLGTGNQIAGPAIVLQMDTTIVMPPGWAGSVDDYGNLLLEMS